MSHGQWVSPYAEGSTEDLILKFDGGPIGQVTAPNPVYTVGIGYSNMPVTGTGGGWELTTSGSTAFGVGLPPLGVIVGASNAQVSAGLSRLDFSTNTSGLSNLVGVSLPMAWSATTTIVGSESWVAPSSQYAYRFDLSLNSSIVSGSPSLFEGISLTISAGSNILYQQTRLADILGITSIVNTTYTGAMVQFNYDPADGPLSISWNAGATVDTALLNLLDGGSSTAFSVSNTAMVFAIPEPSTYALMLGSVGSLCIFMRRKRKATI